MKKRYCSNKIIISGLVALLCANMLVYAQELFNYKTAAARTRVSMSDALVMKVESARRVAASALTRDIEQLYPAMISDHDVGQALQAMQAARQAVEQAIQNQDGPAARAAMEKLPGALQTVQDALDGKSVERIAGRSSPDDYTPPNIYGVPWQTDTGKALNNQLFMSFWQASAFGGDAERDATPE
jgi:hypothetical protein